MLLFYNANFAACIRNFEVKNFIIQSYNSRYSYVSYLIFKNVDSKSLKILSHSCTVLHLYLYCFVRRTSLLGISSALHYTGISNIVIISRYRCDNWIIDLS